MELTNRNNSVDCLKGLAILAVVLYHFGYLPSGFLGVDVFLTIGGYLIIPKLMTDIIKGTYNPFLFIWKRITRFIPLIIIISVFALAIGWFLMLPDDYENLSESVFASNIFANNILQSITVENYWKAVNQFKPLLTTWYLGLIVQIFLIIDVAFYLISLITQALKFRSNTISVIVVISLIFLAIVSLVFYLFAPISYNTKYYSALYRIWEFLIGGIIGIGVISKNINLRKLGFYIGYVILFLFILDYSPFSILYCHIAVVLSTSVILLCSYGRMKRTLLSQVGCMTLSIYLWHQFILAFNRYIFYYDMNTLHIALLFIIIAIVSYISYKIIEPIRLNKRRIILVFLSGWICVMTLSYWIYSRAGVVRDIPELHLSYDKPLEMRNTEYIDRFYAYCGPFSEDKINVLIIGNSFARDFAACLEEWDDDNITNIMYSSNPDWDDDRFRLCDYIFYYGSKSQLESNIKDKIKPNTKIYGIGPKYYGNSLGPIYSHRFKKDYYRSTIDIPANIIEDNNNLRAEWGENNYIDFITLSTDVPGKIKVFTPDSLLISFDGMHLTKWGARYYSKLIDFYTIFQNGKENKYEIH